MMKDAAKKPGLMLAIGLGKAKGKEPAEDTDTMEEEEPSDSTSAAEGVLEAIESRDAAMLESALKLFVKSCNSEY